MSKDNQVLEEFTSKEYEHGWTINIETDSAPKGLNEDIIRFISAKKNEPEWLLEWRLKAYRQWTKMKEPKWPNVTYPPIITRILFIILLPNKRYSLKTWKT